MTAFRSLRTDYANPLSPAKLVGPHETGAIFQGWIAVKRALSSHRPDPQSSPLSEKLLHALQNVTLDPDVEGVAESATIATKQAIAFVDREQPNPSAHVMVSDEGVVTLEWRAPTGGVVLLFNGETATYSVVNPENRFAIVSIDFDPLEGLPQEATEAIARVVAEQQRARPNARGRSR